LEKNYKKEEFVSDISTVAAVQSYPRLQDTNLGFVTKKNFSDNPQKRKRGDARKISPISHQ
jgi:hypothetical protein